MIFAQSGRKKQNPDQTTSTPRQPVVYSTTQPSGSPTPSPTPKPSVTPEKQKPLDEDDVIRIDSTLVPIPVSVTDAKGNAVTNLKLEDFELMVDGEKQVIDELSRSETPVRLALLFDNSSSLTKARDFEIEAAVRFIKRVIRPDKDQATLYSISTVTTQILPLTKDPRQITRAIEIFPPPGGATALLDGIIKASNYLKDVADRRVIVIVSDGVDTISDSSLEETVTAAQIANCQIYVVKTTDFENFQRTGVRGGNANLRDLQAERRMIEITTQTGGAVYSPLDEKELDAAFTQISAELSQQYILSYYPENQRQNEFHTINLRIPSRPNLTIRTRKGYYIPKS
jgi:VWFA-related protein